MMHVKTSRQKRSLLTWMGGAVLLSFAAITAQAQTGELPPNPEPGKCYIKCITQDTFKTVEETVEVSPAYTVLTIVPAQFGSDSRTFQTYPVTAGWEYKTLEDCPSADKDDCVVACYVEYPPKSETVPQVTLVSDAKTNGVPIPEVPAAYTKQVVKVPARMEEVEIPAEYSVITKQVVDTPARFEEVTVPAEYRTVPRTVLDVKGGMTIWEEVDCGVVGQYNVLPILYDFNSAVITTESKKIIDDNLLRLMRDKPGLNIEIASHTDSRASDEYNMSLSQQRAQSVVNYLVSKGISRSRLTARGFGESRLKNRCADGVDCSEAEHQVNRRTEFRILN